MEIEKGIPIPDTKFGYGEMQKYGFGKMDVGDSVFYAFEANRSKETIRNSAYEYGKRHDKKFTTRREGAGVRVWRTA